MEPLILRPSRDLWVPRGRIADVPVFDRALAADEIRRLARLPHYLDGDRASGDTLAIFKPQQNEPPATVYATLNVRNGHLVLEFDTTTQWAAIFAGRMPRNYAGGNFVVSLTWMAASATSGTGGWDVTFERDNGTADVAADHWATAQTVTATTVPGATGTLIVTTVTITAGAAGTASIAAGDDFRIRIRRDVANDNAAGNLQLVSVEIKEA
jgi:hypothetical protein